VAGVAVGVGVPILLAYIYGVVPVSLCQNGVCGVSATPLGVRIDFDDESTADDTGNDNAAASAFYAGRKNTDAASIGTANHLVGNPSIGNFRSISLSSLLNPALWLISSSVNQFHHPTSSSDSILFDYS